MLTIHPMVLCEVSHEVDTIRNCCCSYSVKWHHWSCIIKSLVAIASSIRPSSRKVHCFTSGDRRQYCSLIKECPWAKHLTSLPKRGVSALSSVSASNHKKEHSSCDWKIVWHWTLDQQLLKCVWIASTSDPLLLKQSHRPWKHTFCQHATLWTATCHCKLARVAPLASYVLLHIYTKPPLGKV